MVRNDVTARHAAAKIFAERLKIALVRRGMNQAQAADAAGIPRPTFYSWLRIGSIPEPRYIFALADVLGCSARWLAAVNDDPEPLAAGYPVYDTGAGATWAVADEAEPYHVALPRRLVGYRLHGDSMGDVLRDGQIAWADPEAPLRSGDIAIIEETDGTCSCKVVFDAGDAWTLVSRAPDAPPRTVKKRDVRRAWKVVLGQYA